MTLPVPHAPTVPGPADAVRPVGSDSGFAAGRVADTAETAPMRSYERLPVTGLYSIAHLLPKSKRRCGIYVLSFRNGDRYVGQALDVVVRFAAHRRTYPMTSSTSPSGEYRAVNSTPWSEPRSAGYTRPASRCATWCTPGPARCE
jgi:hypothetical protein